MPTRFQRCTENALHRPVVYAHRGGAMLWPGNTMLAFDEALKAGADVLEMDVRATSDGALVVIHDSTVDKTTNGSGEVTSFTLAALQGLDAGYRFEPPNFPYRGKGLKVPTLDEVFQRYKDRDVCMNIEIKQFSPSVVSDFCELVDKHRMTDKVLVASFYTSILKEVKRKLRDATTSAGTRQLFVYYLLHWLRLTRWYRLPVHSLQFWSQAGPFHIIRKSLVNAATKDGLEIHGWTVNTRKEMRRLIDLKIDGIITDDPKLLIDEINGT